LQRKGPVVVSVTADLRENNFVRNRAFARARRLITVPKANPTLGQFPDMNAPQNRTLPNISRDSSGISSRAAWSCSGSISLSFGTFNRDMVDIEGQIGFDNRPLPLAITKETVP